MKTNKTMTKFLGAATALIALSGCSNDLDFNGAGETRTITAEIMDPSTETRSCVDSETLGLGFLGMMWEPADKIGIYGTADKNVPFANEATSNARKTTFSGHTSGMIQYAYFPWSEANNGVEVTALKGNLPEEQTVYADYHVDADYKYGAVENGTIDTEVRFTHLLSLARLEIDASGTSLSSENIQSIAFSATSNGQPVKMSGDFNFNATNGSLDLTQTTGTVMKAVWQGGSALTGHITGFISMLPTLKAGDKLNIVLLTDQQKVSFHVTLAVDFSAGSVYTFPLSLSAYENKEEYGWTTEPVTPDTEYTETTGTFTCAALNVDGLPAKVKFGISYDVNPNGPQSEGTKLISQAVAKTGWDFFAVSEDFDYDTELNSALGGYNHGTFRAPGKWTSAVTGTLDTDGLNFYWKKDGISAAKETMVQYNESYGGLTAISGGGANTCIKKGFRHYEVTVAEGVVIDVYITHMNTFSGSVGGSHYNAQMKQLEQLRNYVMEKAKANNRPAIIMGDTNMRYTRHAIKETFIDYINNNGLTVNDPWVDFHRPGYPEHGSKSLMINSKYYKDEEDKESGWYDTKNDICCFDNNKGEVVDKIFYINVPGAPLQLKANSYKNDDSDNFVNASKNASHEVTGITYEDENFNIHENYSTTINKRWGLADHFPAVAGFTWTLRTPKK